MKNKAKSFYKVYLSAAISNALNNKYLSDLFDEKDFKVYLPQEITPNEINHTEFPIVVYEQCIEMMEKSDIGLLLLDAYGRDCAWESGWYAARKDKVMVAFVESSSHFTRDWMIKGGLDAFITSNSRLFDVAKNDPILSKKKVLYINDLMDLPNSIKKIYEELNLVF